MQYVSIVNCSLCTSDSLLFWELAIVSGSHALYQRYCAPVVKDNSTDTDKPDSEQAIQGQKCFSFISLCV